ncbi:carboxylesterase/lipase family protein [Nocardia sp. NPDC052566]|uniref:carboxylesterase/lipase family protein n=1 Tax=Nocardia sp. NPDC052566 TaxID=3364330 RepID=UPI0037C55970
MIEQPTAKTTAGVVRGRAEEDVLAFLGVPYAEPPVGPLRWRSARPHPGWAGVRDATAYGPSVPQPWRPGSQPMLGTHGDPPFAEDCLTLNLWTPAVDDLRRPVLVFIHGGGFVTGSGNLATYAGDTFASDGDVVAISINYRVGAFGFLAGLGDANVWLSDQVAALRWIVDNVAAFGGDPAAITLVGHSGGGLAIAALAQHPEARGLFQRGVLQSPAFGVDMQTPETALERTVALARELGHDDIEALRDEPWERLVAGTAGVLARSASFGQWGLAFYPMLDAATMPAHPMQALIDTDIDLLIGWTENEATFAFGMDPRYDTATTADVRAWLDRTHGDRAGAVYDKYATADPGARIVDLVSRIVTDEFFRDSCLQFVRARATSRPVHAYQFEVTTPLRGGTLGAPHCLDLPFTFANLNRWAAAPFVHNLAPGVVHRVTAALHPAWIAFTRTGDPHHPGLPNWPRYTADEPAILRIGDDTIEASTAAGDFEIV